MATCLSELLFAFQCVSWYIQKKRGAKMAPQRYHENGPSFTKSGAITVPGRHQNSATFRRGPVFLKKQKVENGPSYPWGTETVPLFQRGAISYLFLLENGPFLTFFCWKRVPQRNQNSTSFSKWHYFQPFFGKWLLFQKWHYFSTFEAAFPTFFYRENGSSLQRGTISVPLRHRFWPFF